MKSLVRVVVWLTLLLISSQPRAGFMGHAVGLTYEDHFVPLFVPVGQPAPPPILNILQNFGTRTVDGAVEFPNAFSFDIDVADTRIRFHTLSDFISIISLSPFTGFRFHDADGTLPPIVGVTIGLDSHFGLDTSKVSFDRDNVLIDFSGLWIDAGLRLAGPGDFDCGPGICQGVSHFEYVFESELVLNVEFAQVPEPGTVPALAAGLLVLCATIWRRRTPRAPAAHDS
jgi:hypothetical protein